jgi:hypothetical protein
MSGRIAKLENKLRRAESKLAKAEAKLVERREKLAAAQEAYEMAVAASADADQRIAAGSSAKSNGDQHADD